MSPRARLARRLWALLAATALPGAGQALAADSVGRAEAVVGAGDVVRIVVTLGAVLVLIAVLAWLLRRTGNFGGASGTIRILAGVSVGQRERVVLLDVGDRQFLVGVAPGSVRLLERFDEPVVDDARGTPAPADFAARLRGAFARQERGQ